MTKYSIQVTIRLTPEEHHALRMKLAKERETLQDVGRKLLTEWIEKDNDCDV